MVTKQPDYATKPNFGNLLEKHRQLPFKRFMDVITAKLADLNDMLSLPSGPSNPAPFDQFPGKAIPYAVPVLFGPLPLTTPRRSIAAQGGTGFELLANLANPAAFVLPRDGNILIDQEFTFECRSLCAYGFVTWGYASAPGFTIPRLGAVGDIFDPVFEQNGGAMPLDFFGGTFGSLSPQPVGQTAQTDLPNIAFEVELYDRLRGRRLHEQRLPVEMFQGGRIANRTMASPIMFEKGSNIEPRLYLTEIRMGDVLNPTAVFNAASVKAYVVLVFKGRAMLEIPNV